MCYFVTWTLGVSSVTMSDAAVICEVGAVCTSATVKDEALGTDDAVICCGVGVEFTGP